MTELLEVRPNRASAERNDWRGTRWATEPHIRFGDPCFACGTPMTPASRRWSKFTIPDGYRKHGGNALCSSCAKNPNAVPETDQ